MCQLNQASVQPARRMRTPEAKAQRREHILAEARRMFAERAFTEIRVQDIVAETGLAKGTFYLYFPTKEALFLALLLDELGTWFSQLQSRLPAQSWTPETLSALLADSLAQEHILRQLLGLLHNVLEASLDGEQALLFKQELARLMAPMASILEQALPELGPSGGGRLLLKLNALVIGFEQMTRPGPVLSEVMQRPELSFMHPDFETELEHTLLCLLKGWQLSPEYSE